MKFNCDRCGKKYSISDDKLQNYGSTFKIRCQDCKHIIIIANPVQTEASVPKEWYAYIKSKQTGPLSIDEISEYIQNGEITFATLVWKNGMTDWQQAQFIPELKNSLKLPIRTPERRANQTKMLSQIYNEAKTSNEINPDAFDEGEKTVTFSQDEMNEKMNAIKNKEVPSQKQENNNLFKQEEIKKQAEPEQQNEPQIDYEEKEEDETSVSADDFFKKDFEEKKQDKDTKLLRSITGDNTFGNTGIFVMYTQKQRKMKYLFIGILSFVLIISAGIVYYFVTKEPTIVEKEKVVEKVVEKEKIIQGEEKIVYVEVNKNNTKTTNNTSNKTTNTTDTTNTNTTTTDTKTNTDLYGLKTTDTSKVALNVKDDSVYKSESKDKDYVQSVANSVEEKKQGVMTCFQTELKTNPELKAKVQFKLNISSSGRVNDVTAEFTPKSLNESILSDCMTKKIKSWKFPENPDGGATEFSFKLALQGQ